MILRSTPTPTAIGTDRTSVAANVTTIDQRAAPPVFQIERASAASIALQPARIMSAANTAIGTLPTRPGGPLGVSGQPGSHVIVLVGESGSELDRDTIRFAASLAAAFSSARAARQVSVHYASCADISKRRGQPPGEVMLRDWKSVRVAPQHDVPVYECVIDDGTGTVMAVFLGRRELAAVNIGTRIELHGTVGVHRERLAILNPTYRVLTAADLA